ncbi:cholesterol oxidase substrate-binding domain-containing protein [Streptomyces syringium]|uniref:cholesterol oxidase substrate-binding domain-containing protein n=1 Tax=Streptomyces syringium TaxID=76729 RepID=UPI00369112A7
MTRERHPAGALPRRSVLGAPVALAGGWTVIGREPRAAAASAAPPGFPSSVELYREIYENWDGEVRTDALWTCAPRDSAEVVAVADWARSRGFAVRARGARHGWAPLTVADGTPASAKVVLADTTRYLTAMRMESSSPAAVRVQPGATMDALLAFLERHGFGLTSVPVVGALTVGGVLAVDGHGSAVPARGERRMPGHGYGSLSNLVVSLKAVVWDGATRSYVERVFERSHPDCKAFLTHLGRSFVTEVTLRVGENYRLRCVNHLDVPATELFAPPGRGTGARSLAGYLDRAGRVVVSWFPFTTHPWVQVWSVTPERPPLSRPVTSPYNYPFVNAVPRAVSDLAERVLKGEPALTPALGQLQYTVTAAGLTAGLAWDMWGWSKNFLLFVKPTAVRGTLGSHAILTSRGSVQRVVAEFAAFYRRLLEDYRARGLFPVNIGVEMRISGLDDPAEAGVPHAEPPALSAIRPREEHPDWDTAVWFDVATFAETPGSHSFYRDLEDFYHRTYDGSYAAPRVEWSKRWAHTDEGAWRDPAVLGGRIPESFLQGPHPTWDWAVGTLDGYDPHRVFTTPLLDTLLRAGPPGGSRRARPGLSAAARHSPPAGPSGPG